LDVKSLWFKNEGIVAVLHIKKYLPASWLGVEIANPTLQFRYQLILDDCRPLLNTGELGMIHSWRWSCRQNLHLASNAAIFFLSVGCVSSSFNGSCDFWRTLPNRHWRHACLDWIGLDSKESSFLWKFNLYDPTLCSGMMSKSKQY
jgi:hypothetical protein